MIERVLDFPGVGEDNILQQKCLNGWIGSAHRNTILQLSTPNTDPERSKLLRVTTVWKSCIKTKRHQKQTSVWNCNSKYDRFFLSNSRASCFTCGVMRFYTLRLRGNTPTVLYWLHMHRPTVWCSVSCDLDSFNAKSCRYVDGKLHEVKSEVDSMVSVQQRSTGWWLFQRIEMHLVATEMQHR